MVDERNAIDEEADTEVLEAIVDEDIPIGFPSKSGLPMTEIGETTPSDEESTLPELVSTKGILYQTVQYVREALSNWVTPDDYIPNSQACIDFQKQGDIIKKIYSRSVEKQHDKIIRLEKEEIRLNGRIEGLNAENRSLMDEIFSLETGNENLNGRIEGLETKNKDL